MTIRKGSGYGANAPLPPGAPIASSDAELCRLVIEARHTGTGPTVVGLLGGDLCRTLGGTGDPDRLRSPSAVTIPVDLGIVTLDGVDHPFVAHVVVGRPFGDGFAAIMNAQWFGVLDLGPRSHPGDGLLDITTGSLPWRQRRLALRRARTGTHLPHPLLSQRRVDRATLQNDSHAPILLDGSTTASATTIEVRVEADAFNVVI